MAKLYLRVIAFLLDMFFLLIMIMVCAFYLTKALNISSSLFQVLPFIIIECIIFPLGSLLTGTFWSSIPTYTIVLLSAFLLEILYYFATDMLPAKATLGKLIMGIKIHNIQNANNQKIMIRAVTKTISRYLLLLPFTACLFNDKKQTLHDIIAKTIVIKTGLSKEEVAKLKLEK